MSWNIEGLRGCSDDSDYVNFVDNFDLCFLTETWQRRENEFCLKGFDCVDVPRPESLKQTSKRGHGGVCLFIRHAIKEGVHILEKDNSGLIWVKLDKNFFSMTTDVCICFVYVPPSNSVYYNNHEIGYFELLEQGIRKYSNLGQIAICGDLNSRCGNRNDILFDDENLVNFIPTVDIDDLDQIQKHNLPARRSLDNVCNSSGLKLLDLCQSCNLCIVNGRKGDDAGIGNITYMSSKGQSVIDYVIADSELFDNIENFIVHDFYSFSSHAPIQIDFKANHSPSTSDEDNPQTIHKIKWDKGKKYIYLDKLTSDYHIFENIVDNVINSRTSFDEGINTFASTLYSCSYAVFGTITHNNSNTENKTHTTPWFTTECKAARADLRRANKLYRKHKTIRSRELLSSSRKHYRRAKRISKGNYLNRQRQTMHSLASNSPNKFWSELRRLRGKNKTQQTKLSADDFYSHFKHLYSPDEIYSDPNTHDRLSQESVILTNIEQLDCSFTCDEVRKTILKMKRNKAFGIDLLLAEMFIDGVDILTPILCKLFNHIFDNGLYPESWTKGLIVPIPKKGDLNDVNNFRGITLSSIFSKIFSCLLDSRLRNWAESNELLLEYQFGFRSKKSTIDCVFILQSLINKILKHEKKKLFCAFIDFRKAFDLVYRDGLWLKLIEYGVSTKMITMLRSMYNSVKSCVQVNGSLSEYFDSYMGVKQGESLSPLLFIFFVNDMHTCLQQNTFDVISIDELQIFLLLFADDTALFSYSKDGLQHLLNQLHVYCDKWNITVNIDKTVVMTFKNGKKVTDLDIKYNGCLLKNVDTFSYLGVTLSSTGSFYQTQKVLAQQGMKALFSLNSLFDIVPLHVNEKIKLFDSMVAPILNYGSELWGFHTAPEIERVHTKFLKQVLGVKTQTTNNAVYGELGRFPMQILRKIRIVKYWYKIMKSPDSLLHKTLHSEIDINGFTLINDSWATKVKTLLNTLGFGFLWNNSLVTNLQIEKVIERIIDQYVQSWNSDLSISPKLSTYASFKTFFESEKYLLCLNNDKYRKALSRLRCSAHNLEIEEGRYRNVDRQDRICKQCNMKVLENEYHFTLVCPRYHDLRRAILPKYYCNWPTNHKFVGLMKSSQSGVLFKLAKFVYLATEVRNANA